VEHLLFLFPFPDGKDAGTGYSPCTIQQYGSKGAAADAAAPFAYFGHKFKE
jgi:hypothetical protein